MSESKTTEPSHRGGTMSSSASNTQHDRGKVNETSFPQSSRSGGMAVAASVSKEDIQSFLEVRFSVLLLRYGVHNSQPDVTIRLFNQRKEYYWTLFFDVCNMCIVRKDDHGNFVLNGTYKFERDVLRKGLVYKYYVDGLPEKIYTVSGDNYDNIYRWLTLDYCKDTTIYDHMVRLRMEHVPGWRFIPSRFRPIVDNTQSDAETTVVSLSPKWKSIESDAQCAIATATLDELYTVISCQSRKALWVRGIWWDYKVEVSIKVNRKKVLLTMINEQLQHLGKGKGKQPTNSVISALLISVILHENKVDLEWEQVNAIANAMLSDGIYIDVIEELRTHFPDRKRTTLALQKLCENMMAANKNRWFFILPLLHFLDGYSIPYNIPPKRTVAIEDKGWWGMAMAPIRYKRSDVPLLSLKSDLQQLRMIFEMDEMCARFYVSQISVSSIVEEGPTQFDFIPSYILAAKVLKALPGSDKMENIMKIVQALTVKNDRYKEQLMEASQSAMKRADNSDVKGMVHSKWAYEIGKDIVMRSLKTKPTLQIDEIKGLVSYYVSQLNTIGIQRTLYKECA
ncbi:uncharacterized protein LOC144436802 [Glandiceps talaboti]